MHRPPNFVDEVICYTEAIGKGGLIAGKNIFELATPPRLSNETYDGDWFNSLGMATAEGLWGGGGGTPKSCLSQGRRNMSQPGGAEIKWATLDCG